MSYRSLLVLAAVSTSALVGCSSNATLDPTAIGDKQASASLAAYAATAKYPTTAPSSNDTRIAAFTHGSEIKIVNFSHDTIPDAAVWVNGLYVAKVGSIPASGTVAVGAGRFYDNTGRVLNTEVTPVSKVELETGNSLHSVLGPAVEQ